MIETGLLTEADQLFDLKEFVLALEAYKKVLSLNNKDVEARMGAALCLVQLRRYAEAIPLLSELENIMPDSEQLQFMLAESCLRTERITEAEERLVALVGRYPANAAAQIRLGCQYLDKEQYPSANSCFKAALSSEPDNVEALAYMGIMMIKFCQFDDAFTVLHKAQTIEPRNVLVLNNLGRTCMMTGRHTDALQWYRKALDVEPNNATVIGNYLFALNYCDGLEPEYIAAEHFRLAPLYLYNDAPEPAALQLIASSNRLRIGYISGDFYTHSVAYFIEPILQHHDYKRFDVFCYSLGTTTDATTERLKALPCQWRDLTAASPKILAGQIRKDRIDILIDLSGHTADNRLGVFAVRAAPVQVSWIGYPNTSGLSQMDYYMTDSICDPPGMTEHLFCERLWRLPRVFCCYLPPMEFPSVSPVPFASNGYITFGSFNNFAKVTRQQITLWARIMKTVPESRLYLKSLALGDSSVKQDVLTIFANEGVAAERIFMRVVTKTPLEHLQEYANVDIALDTFPYHGTTTTCEALWMGTPVITMAGSTHVSRVGVSLLQNVGCAEFVAFSPEDYVNKAVALASAPEKLMLLRNSLRGMMAESALMDVAGVTRELEEAFIVMSETVSHRRKDGL